MLLLFLRSHSGHFWEKTRTNIEASLYPRFRKIRSNLSAIIAPKFRKPTNGKCLQATFHGKCGFLALFWRQTFAIQ
ncbi:hypothetical protein CXQ82_28985 [Pseudomonas sp. S09G 359]|nr:hypothetical protein CXQ82_28985 [Pseudomonas sp. S09G 359]